MAGNSFILCPAPFLSDVDFPGTGGYIGGRFCSLTTDFGACCIPCPLENWVYADNFQRNTRIADWSNVVGICMNAFLLLTFAVLHPSKSHRHYLSVGLCASLIMLQLAFVIPLGTRPEQCYDAITPNGMKSSMSCAWTGALVLAGGMSTVVWILLRSLWTHLRVCWNTTHSQLYFLVSQILGWGIPALFLAISLAFTGVSYRLGGTCFPNQHNSFADFFGWVLAFAGLAFLLQCATSGYCLWVYAQHFWLSESDAPLQVAVRGGSGSGSESDGAHVAPQKAGDATADDGGELGSGNPGSIQRWSASRKQTWKRVRKVFYLQWRSITLSVLVIIETVYFATAFVAENSAVVSDQRHEHAEQVEAWARCLVLSGGDKNACLTLTKGLGVSEATAIASLIMLALTGISSFILLVRWSMITGWIDLFKHPRQRPQWQQCYRGNQFNDNDDFVRLEPKRVSLGTTLVDTPLDSPLIAKFQDKATTAKKQEQRPHDSGGESKRLSKRFSWTARHASTVNEVAVQVGQADGEVVEGMQARMVALPHAL